MAARSFKSAIGSLSPMFAGALYLRDFVMQIDVEDAEEDKELVRDLIDAEGNSETIAKIRELYEFLNRLYFNLYDIATVVSYIAVAESDYLSFLSIELREVLHRTAEIKVRPPPLTFHHKCLLGKGFNFVGPALNIMIEELSYIYIEKYLHKAQAIVSPRDVTDCKVSYDDFPQVDTDFSFEAIPAFPSFRMEKLPKRTTSKLKCAMRLTRSEPAPPGHSGEAQATSMPSGSGHSGEAQATPREEKDISRFASLSESTRKQCSMCTFLRRLIWNLSHVKTKLEQIPKFLKGEIICFDLNVLE